MTEFEWELELLQREGLKQSALRREYEQKVGDLALLPPKLQAEGKNVKTIRYARNQEERMGGIC